MLKWMCLFGFGLALSCPSISAADGAKEKAESKEKAKPKVTRGAKATQKALNKIEIAADQKEKIAEIDKEFAEAFAALKKARADILTADQKKAEKEANAANKAASKTGAEAKKAVETALNLTDEQKTKLKEWRKSETEFNAKVVEALQKVLTPEQQAKLPKTSTAKTSAAKTTTKKPAEADSK